MSTFGNGQGNEQRQFGRRQTQLHGWITVPGRPRLACVVQNLSVNGALLAFDQSPVGLPYTFKLTIEASRFETHCEIKHQNATRVGVQFMAAAAATSPEQRPAAGSVQEWTGLGRGALAAGPKR